MAMFSPTQISHQDFQSQVPFQTQFLNGQTPYNVIQTTVTPEDPGDEGLRADRVAGKSRSSIERQGHSRTPRHDAASVNHTAKTFGLDTTDGEAASSEESIACEPLTLPLTAVPSSLQTRPVHPSANTQQPFPLVEWIRRIREQTEVERPTLPLRWCRSISRQQQAILDTEDAWSPPLPGRPARQGTIPIELLTALTEEVDHRAEETRSKEIQLAGQVSSRTSRQSSIAEQPQRVESDLPSPTRINQAASQVESAVAWSSSPPSPRRRLLPPDTSPLQPASKQGQKAPTPTRKAYVGRAPHIDTGDNLNTIQERTSRPPADIELLDTIPRSHSSHDTREEDMSIKMTEGRLGRLQADSVLSSPPGEESPSVSFMQPPKTVTRRKGEILVKHTPYPLKASTKNFNRNITTEGLPQSSLVTGTYPEPIFNHRRPNFSPNPDSIPASLTVPIDNAAIPSDEDSMELDRPPPTGKMKRTHQEANREGNVDERQQLGSQHRVHQSTSNEMHKYPTQKRSKASSGGSHATVSRSTAQESESSDTDTKARLEEERIQRKIQERRIARRKWSKRKPENSTEITESPDLLRVHERALASSVILSARSKRINPNVLQPECGSTPVTALSQHGASHSSRKQGPTDLPTTSPQISSPNVRPTELLPRFISAYPDYKGNLKTFEAAVRLLTSHQVHQSLFDDFVFRMANEYPKYRDECTERDEDLLSYRNYYDTYVEQSERRSKIITKKTLDSLAVHLKRPLATPQKAASNLGNETYSPAVGVSTPGPQILQDQSRPTAAHAVPQIQPSPISHRAASTERTPIAKDPGMARQSEIGVRSGISAESKKRRSLPWASEVRPQMKTSAIIQPTQTQGPVAPEEPTDVSSTVEQWLGRPAGALSPEIEGAPVHTPALHVEPPTSHIQTPNTAKKAQTEISQRKNLKVSASQLPTYLATQRNESVKETDDTSPAPIPSVTASDIASASERPVTPFRLFAREFAKLRTERTVQGLPINVYNW